MASLGEVVGAFISQIGRGRSQADAATLEVAKIYKDHPLLSAFPVPRMTLDEVVVDLKLSIAAPPIAGRILTAKAKFEVLSQLEKKMKDLTSAEPSLRVICQKFPKLEEAWKSTYNQLVGRLSELIPTEVEVEPRTISLGAASIIREHVSNLMLTSDPRRARIEITAIRKFVSEDAPKMENRLTSQIQEIISKVLEVQPPMKDRLDILITSSELQTIPHEKLTTLKFTLRESDQTWTQIETEKGEIKEKLVPS